MTTIAEWYKRVNEAWPADVPPLTFEEAGRAAKRLYRYAMGSTWTGKVRQTTGRRYTWIRHGEIVINTDKGWKDMVHLLSHYFHRKLSREKPHSGEHARLELRMIKEVVKRGYLTGALKSEPVVKVPDDAQRVKLERIEASLKRWETKAKRAATYIKKLTRERSRVQRRISMS